MCKICGNPCGKKPCCFLTTSGAGNPPVGLENRIYTNTLTGVTYIIDSEGIATALTSVVPLIDRFQEFDNLTSGNSVTVSIAPDPAGTITVIRNGAVQFESASADYTRTGSTFTFNVPFGSVVGGSGAEKVRIEYKSNT